MTCARESYRNRPNCFDEEYVVGIAFLEMLPFMNLISINRLRVSTFNP